ncbi:hypothetical protein SAMN06295912_13523 [Sphingomonas laterariae]|uniref:Uncharacterized protein n=1 Tax=Edaphosphingomonas laterariae TaxID=861865 RepID=A0A239JIJ3_9SPHN|nr:hypothetical protein [Sphingomonas laterariae]SNT05711.1 hypothetical protein SAMN06295912_13523 [Sphingomonas laterariae]
MSNVVQLRPADATQRLWEAYRVLAQRIADNPRLRVDVEFQQEMVRAWKRWADAYLAEDAA